jgi:hypothetical protein
VHEIRTNADANESASDRALDYFVSTGGPARNVKRATAPFARLTDPKLWGKVNAPSRAANFDIVRQTTRRA